VYEKPQYPTPNGYRRMSENPCRKGSKSREIADFLARNGHLRESIPAKQEQKSHSSFKPGINPNVARILKCREKPGISDEAAKLIAASIKSLLQSK